MLQIKERTKNYIIKEKYHKHKNIVRNCKRRDDNYMYNFSTNLLSQFQATKASKKKREIEQ